MLYNSQRINYIFMLLVLIYAFLIIPIKSYSINNKYSINLISEDIDKSLLEKWKEELETRSNPTIKDPSNFYYLFEQDQLLLKKLLESEGYYKAIIKSNFDEDKSSANYIIQGSKQYLFRKIKIVINGEESRKLQHKNINIPTLKDLEAQPNTEAQTNKVINDEQIIRNWLEKNNCFFKISVSHKATINHILNTVDITYLIEHYKQATYGEIQFYGQKTIDEDYLNSLLPIRKGECFQRSSLNNSKLMLRKSNLLEKVEIILPKEPNNNGSVPLTFLVTERMHRTIKTGINYSTDIGAGITTGWEHRNILSHGETFSTKISIAEIERKLDLELEKPFFIRSDQKLKIFGSIKKENNEAYHSNGLDISSTIEREYDNKWTAGIGSKYSFEHILDQDNDETTMLLSTPIFLSQDKRNNLLDPQEGWTIYFNTTPAFDTVDVSTSFLKNSIQGTYYQSIFDSEKSILALRTALGSIIGASSNTIPATERFYGGGSGSIRGYGYQLASPLDEQNDPIGGRSLIESSAEIRFRVSDDYGIVPFIDCGSSFVDKLITPQDSLLCGAGIGLRYYTLFGPFRIDLASPLTKRSGIDDPFQIYFSIGQSF